MNAAEFEFAAQACRLILALRATVATVVLLHAEESERRNANRAAISVE
jgi:hypothetical protein